MKKILIMLFALAQVAVAQDNQQTKTKTKTKTHTKTIQQSTDENSSDQTTSSLDGKTFKITFTSAKSKGSVNNYGNKENDNSSRNYSQSTPASQSNMNQENGSTNGDFSQWNQAFYNQHAILKFENGKLSSKMMMKNQIQECSYTVTASAGETTSFTSTCMADNKTGMQNDNYMHSDRNSDNTTYPNRTGNTNNSNQSTTGTSGTMNSMDNSGNGNYSNQSNTGTSDSLNTTGNSGNTNYSNQSTTTGTSGSRWNSSNNNMNNGSATASITGVVSGNTISGTLTVWMSNGEKMSYPFTGTKATKAEINSDRETGMNSQ